MTLNALQVRQELMQSSLYSSIPIQGAWDFISRTQKATWHQVMHLQVPLLSTKLGANVLENQV